VPHILVLLWPQSDVAGPIPLNVLFDEEHQRKAWREAKPSGWEAAERFRCASRETENVAGGQDQVVAGVVWFPSSDIASSAQLEMPPSKRPRVDKSSPSKSSPLASPSKSKGKGKARASPALSPLRRRPQRNPDRDGASSSSDEEPSDYDDEPIPTGASFITASSGDAYLLHSASSSKTSDALLSSSIDPAFTFPSYASALSTFDSNPSPAFAAQRATLKSKSDAYERRFPKWMWEMQQGFNVLAYGFGSKRGVLNAFAEKARSRGNVIVVNGFDAATSLGDVMLALEELVKTAEREDEATRGSTKRLRGRKGAASPVKSKGKGKAANQDGAPPPATKVVLPPSVSAIESRVRRFCHSLHSASSTLKSIYLVIHNLDGPSLRPSKILSLLALLAAQPRIHLLASVDHLRAALLFPTSLSTTRPPHQATASSTSDLGPATTTTTLEHDIRTFTFLHYETPTLLPSTLEVSHAGTLSRLLPATVFPRLSTSLDPSSSSLAQSTAHVLASVTDRAKRLFGLLGRTQLALFETVGEREGRSMLLTPGAGAPCPPVATLLETYVIPFPFMLSALSFDADPFSEQLQERRDGPTLCRAQRPSRRSPRRIPRPRCRSRRSNPSRHGTRRDCRGAEWERGR
jgi:origin recognition complex subunit 2